MRSKFLFAAQRELCGSFGNGTSQGAGRVLSSLRPFASTFLWLSTNVV